MDEKTKLMKVETADRIFTVMTNATHPFDIIDGHLIFLDDKGFPATSFAPGAWLNVLSHEGE